MIDKMNVSAMNIISKKHRPTVEARHAFGGCNNLLQHYQRIGAELCELDSGIRRYGLMRNYENFRVGVTTVPVEVLESYFEDLIDIEIPEEKLFIRRRNIGHFFQVLSLIGLVGAFAWGLWSVERGASPVVSFFFTLFMSAPFGVLWHCAPRIQIVRRLGFARVISQEIFRRRGGGKDEGRGANASMVISELLSPQTPSMTGAARRIYH
jgi:hypothetical protein